MKKTFTDCQEIVKDHEFVVENETENLRSYLCKSKTFAYSTYWFRVIFSPLYISVYGDFGTFTINCNHNDSFKWFLDIHNKELQYILNKIPMQLKNSFYTLSKEKVLLYLKEVEKKCLNLNLYNKRKYVEKMILRLDDLTDERIYDKCLTLCGDDPDKMPDINDYNYESYMGVAALFKLNQLYREKIKKDYDKFMFENFMTPAIAEYKNELS